MKTNQKNPPPALTPWDRTDAECTVAALPRKQNFFTYILKMGRFTARLLIMRKIKDSNKTKGPGKEQEVCVGANNSTQAFLIINATLFSIV